MELRSAAQYIYDIKSECAIQDEFYRERGNMFGFRMVVKYEIEEVVIIFEDGSKLLNEGHTWRVI